MAAEYQAVVDDFRSNGGSKVKLISSEVDFGVYGRFLLASAARTRYVYIVDDDVSFPVSATGTCATSANSQEFGGMLDTSAGVTRR